MGQCHSGEDEEGGGRQKSRRGSLSLRQNQVYHLNHIECLPYQGRRSRYSTQSSSFLALVTRQNSAPSTRQNSAPSTRQNSMAGSQPILLIEPGPDPVLNRDSPLASSNPVLARQLRRYSGGVPPDDPPPPHHCHQNHHHQRRQSLAELQRGLSYEDYRRGGGGRAFRSYLDYQAVRQSYLLAVSQDSLLEQGTGEGTAGQLEGTQGVAGGGQGVAGGGQGYTQTRQSTLSLSMY